MGRDLVCWWLVSWPIGQLGRKLCGDERSKVDGQKATLEDGKVVREDSDGRG